MRRHEGSSERNEAERSQVPANGSLTGLRLGMARVVPITLGVTVVRVAVPPSVIFAPAVFSLCVQVVPPGLGLRAVFAVMADGIVQFRFCLFDAVLALGPCRRHKWGAVWRG